MNESELIKKFMPLVKGIAYKIKARLPANVDVDDMIQDGLIGLLSAIRRNKNEVYNERQFMAFAVCHINGSIMDEFRKSDDLPGNLRRADKKIEATISKLEGMIGRSPKEHEVAQYLNISLEEYQKLLRRINCIEVMYYQDLDIEDENFLEMYGADPHGDPLDRLIEKNTWEKIIGSLGELQDREKTIMNMYYYEGMTLSEIGEVMGVTESRICQLQKKAVKQIQSMNPCL